MSFELQNVRRVFSLQANTWDMKKNLIMSKHGETRRLYQLLKDIIKKNDYVLDMGCGTGKVTKHILNEYPHAHVFSADISLNMLKNLNNKIANGNCLLMDGERNSFCDNVFDVVAAQQFLHHTASPSLVLNEIYRITKTNGHFLLLTVGDEHHKNVFPYEGIGMLQDPFGRVSKEEIIHLLEKSHFIVDQVIADFFQFEFLSFDYYVDFIYSIGSLHKIYQYNEPPATVRSYLRKLLIDAGQIRADGTVFLDGHYISIVARKNPILRKVI